jgi:hypothetical protein
VSYPLLAVIWEIDLLAPPFVVPAAAGEITVEGGKVFVCDDPLRIGRGRALNRYTGEKVYVTPAVGWGDGSFAEGVFGWS